MIFTKLRFFGLGTNGRDNKVGEKEDKIDKIGWDGQQPEGVVGDEGQADVGTKHGGIEEGDHETKCKRNCEEH